MAGLLTNEITGLGSNEVHQSVQQELEGLRDPQSLKQEEVEINRSVTNGREVGNRYKQTSLVVS